MKLHCHRPALAAALQVVGSVVPSRTPKEVLKNVKLQVAGGKATLLGTDAEIGVGAASWNFNMVGRLKPGITPSQAVTDATLVANETMRAYQPFMASLKIRPVVRSLSRIAPVAARPSIPGICTSISTRSKLSRCRAASASPPLDTAAVEWPCF